MTEPPPPFPEPTAAAGSRTKVLLRYLDYFRACLVDRIAGLPEVEVQSSRVPSGWTSLEIAVHLSFVERRWLEWGFEGREVNDPWGDQVDGRWHVPTGRNTADILGALREQGERTRAIVSTHDLADAGAPGPRWDGEPPATLERVLLHLMQEYARHLGHLDIVVEQAGGAVGE